MRTQVGGIIVAVVLLSCQAAGNLGASGAGSAGGEASAKCGGDLGATAAAQKVEVFLASATAFSGAATDLSGSLHAVCKKMGRDLGLEDKALGGDTKTACGAVAERLKADLASLNAEAKLKIAVVAQPPRCEVDVDAYAACDAACDVSVKPGEAELECHGGEMVGQCDAICEGSCVAKAEGVCKGSCEGTCSTACTGKCEGVCDGQCSKRNAAGECVGKCEGTCRGTCSSGCKGECSGTCSVNVEGSCKGECRGGCSVEYKAPRCTGTLKGPEVDADCRASCDARLNANAKCTPPEVRVTVTGKVKGDAEAKFNRVRMVLEESWGEFLAVQAKLERVGATGEALVRASGGVPGAAAKLGLQASACAAQAAAGVPKAVANVSASVEVSVSLSAAVSGSAG